MNYKTIKELKNQIKHTRTQLECARASAENVNPQIDGQPRAKYSKQSRVENSAIKIISLEKKLSDLCNEYNAAVASVPNTYEGDIIRLKICGHSWRQISYAITGSGNNRDAIRKTVARYNW